MAVKSLTRRVLQPIIDQALEEDLGRQDVTSKSLFPKKVKTAAEIVVKESGVLAGVQIAVWTLQTVDKALRVKTFKRDGQKVQAGDKVLAVEGSAESIFIAERTALNFLGHLSGVATMTAQYVDAVKGTSTLVLDTRKTVPGLRHLEKEAVRVGGGMNHRIGLHDMVLIKTNHLRVLFDEWRDRGRSVKSLADVIPCAIERARKRFPRHVVEIEVMNLEEFEAALAEQPDIILLDNWKLPGIRKAVGMRKRLPLLEISGGVKLQQVNAIAKTGIDRVSIGSITHSAPNLDLSLSVVL